MLYFKTPALPLQEIFFFQTACIRRLGTSMKTQKICRYFQTAFKDSVREPVVLILDDFNQRWTAANRRFPTMLSSLIQRADPKSRLFVLLCKPASLYEKESPEEAALFPP